MAAKRKIGFIGKANITPHEAGLLWYIGRCIAALGHEVLLVPAKGAANALREGVEIEGGRLTLLTTGTVEQADHTHIYPDAPLLEKLKKKYPDIEDRPDVLIIPRDRLDEWYEAVRTVLVERGVTPPT